MTITAETLSCFVPFNSLSQQTLEHLAASAEEIIYTPSKIIFVQGEADKRLYFLRVYRAFLDFPVEIFHGNLFIGEKKALPEQSANLLIKQWLDCFSYAESAIFPT